MVVTIFLLPYDYWRGWKAWLWFNVKQLATRDSYCELWGAGVKWIFTQMRFIFHAFFICFFLCFDVLCFKRFYEHLFITLCDTFKVLSAGSQGHYVVYFVFVALVGLYFVW